MWKSIKFIKIYIYMFSFFVHLFFYIVLKKINLNRKKDMTKIKLKKFMKIKLDFMKNKN